MTPAAQRPSPAEFGAFYHGYVARVPDGDVLQQLERQAAATAALIAGLDERRGGHRYAPGKWSVKQVLNHVIDGERVFAYRALRFARGDSTPLPGFDENLFARNDGADVRPLGALREEYESVRAATLTLFRGLAAGAWLLSGTASQSPLTVRSLAWIIAGHELHHRAVLRERYGLAG